MTDVTELTPAEDSPRAQIAKLEAENGQRLQALMQRGRPLPPEVLLNARLEQLIEYVIGPAAQLQFDADWEMRVERIITSFEEHVNRSMLTDGVQLEMPKDLG